MPDEGGRRATWLVVAFAVLFNLVFLTPELTIPAPVLHDGVLHIAATRAAAAAIAAGRDPTDTWLPGVVLGYPLFHYYQHLPHVITALVATLVGALEGHDAVPFVLGFATWLLLGLFPVSVFWSARRFGFDRPTAACASLLAPLISTNGLFGFEFGSYLWRGFGLYGQLWGMVLLPPALAQGTFVLRRGRGYLLAVVLLSLTALSNLVFAYIAFGSMAVLALLAPPKEGVGRGLLRLVLLAVPLGLVTSYLLVPMLLDSAYFGRSVWWERPKFDSFGHERILGELFRGTLFDYGRFPSLTILVAAGAVVCVRRWRDERYRVPLVLFILWLALYFGRPTWGVLLDLTPLSKEFHFHRLSAGVHLAGIYLMGAGLAAVWEFARERRTPLPLAGAALATAALLFPVYRERVTFLTFNRTWMRNAQRAFAAEEKDLTALLGALRAAPPGRVYAGLAGTWGAQYRVGEVPLYAYLTQNGFDTLAMLYHVISFNGDVQVYFDESRADHYQLFNVRYVVAPADRPVAPFARLIGTFGRHRLYRVETTGYFDLVNAGPTLVGAKTDWYPVALRWLQGPQPAARQHPAIVIRSVPPGTEPTFPLWCAHPLVSEILVPAAPPLGRVTTESLGVNRYEATVEVDRPATLMLKTGYSPLWNATVDGVGTPTRMLMPSYVGVSVSPGTHRIVLVYRPRPVRYALMGLGLLALIGTFLADRRARGRLEPSDVPTARVHDLLARIGFGPGFPFVLGSLGLALLAGLPLLQLKVMSGHDQMEYVPRIVEFWRALTGGQLLPRWAPDLGGGYGQPFFIFNPPLVYAVASVFHALGFGFVSSENLAALALLFLSAGGMYLLASEFLGARGGVVSAAAYVFAPYMSAKLYVNHALADYSALAVLPFAFLGLTRFARGGRFRDLIVGCLGVALLSLSSNPVSLMTFPALAALVVSLAWQERDAAVGARGSWCLALGLGVATFSWLPALVERNDVHLHRLLEGLMDYRDHFLGPSALLDPALGGRLARPGQVGWTSLAVGPVHLALAVASILLIRRIRAVSARSGAMVLFFAGVATYGAFFSVRTSAFLWDRIALLHYFEFSWRFLTMVALGTAFLAGFPLLLVPEHRRKAADGLMVTLVAIILIFNFPHASPATYLELSDADFSPQVIAGRWLGVTTTEEYEPIGVRQRPDRPAETPAVLSSGTGRVTVVRRGTVDSEYLVETDGAARLRLNTFFFPGWVVRVDGRAVPVDHSAPQGFMEIPLDRGAHRVRLVFTDTPVRRFGGWLSLLSVGLLLATPRLTRRVPILGHHEGSTPD